MRLPFLIGLLAAGACASSGAPRVASGTPGADNVSIAQTNTSRVYNPDAAVPDTAYLDARLDRAWAFLPEVFRGFGLDVALIDPATHTVDGQKVRARGQFAGNMYSKYLDCGDTRGAPNANRYEITMHVVTRLAPAGERTLVATTVVAEGRFSETGGTAVPCAANGEIAKQVLTALRAAAR
jgi:hypothetical protein